jgi:hypothetical protein
MIRLDSKKGERAFPYQATLDMSPVGGKRAGEA